VLLFDTDGTAVDTLAMYDNGVVAYLIERGAGFLPQGWGASGFWAASGDSLLALVDGARGTVEILKADGGRLHRLRSGNLAITPIPLEEKDWIAVGERAREESERPLGRWIGLSGPYFQSQVGGGVFSSEGTLWVSLVTYLPFEKPPEGLRRYLLIPVDGRRQEIRTLPPGVVLKAVSGEYLIGLRRTEFDVPVVVVLKHRR
jgi:hypothetical protein